MEFTRAEIEKQIRDLVATATNSITLSNLLFTPEGLFARLAATEPERRLLVKTELFRTAQRRVRELQKRELADFSKSIAQFEAMHPGESFVFKMEVSKSLRTAVRP